MTFSDICDRIAMLYFRSEFTTAAYRARFTALRSGRNRIPSRLPSLTNRRDAFERSLLAFR